MEPQSNSDQSTQNATEPTASAVEVPKTEETKTTEVPKGNVSEYRTFAILGYILPFLFFLPLLGEKTKNVPYVRFHANQQLVFLVVVVAEGILEDFLPLSFYYSFSQIFGIVLIAYSIIGIINAYKGEAKELPFIGWFKILK